MKIKNGSYQIASTSLFFFFFFFVCDMLTNHIDNVCVSRKKYKMKENGGLSRPSKLNICRINKHIIKKLTAIQFK